MIPDRAVFDTNILIEYCRDIPGAVRTVEQCADRLVSQITWIEFLVGVPETEQERMGAFLRENFDIIHLDEDISAQTVSLRRMNKRMKLPDAIIYATAKIWEVPLITRNTKDFDETAPDIYIPYK